MAWDFETDPDFQQQLDWMEGFVRDEIIPLETLAGEWRTPEGREAFRRITDPLKEEVRQRGLWAAHLPPDMGGLGFGQVKLGLMHEILGQTAYGPSIFGNNAPDSGNAELIAVGGTPEQKERWMQPLLDGKYRSCFSMTEPGAGADPTLLTTSVHLPADLVSNVPASRVPRQRLPNTHHYQPHTRPVRLYRSSYGRTHQHRHPFHDRPDRQK